MSNIPEEAKMQIIANRVDPGIGNNGVGTQAQIALNDARIMNDSAYVQSELARTQEVIRNRAKQGLDTSVQTNYLNRLMSSPALQQPSSSNQGFNQDAEMQKILDHLRGISDGYLRTQQGVLEANKASQIAQLQQAYSDAIAEGKISVRDAEAQFEQQKREIEKQAYLDAEGTALYAHNMGIQNSQQMIGLMQGDQARNKSMINENMTIRDKRISDIKDRLNAIKMKQDLDIARVNAEYDAGLLRAQGEANQMYAQGAFGLMQDNFSANRNQAFNRENMAIQQGYNLQNMAIQHQNTLAQMREQSSLRINEMGVGHKLDLEKMDKAFDQDLMKMAKQFGYSSALQSQAHNNAINEAKAKMKMQIEAEQKAYELAVKREEAKYKQGTPEFSIRMNQLDDAFKNRVAEIHTTTVYNALAESVFNNPALQGQSTAPKNWRDGGALNKYNPFSFIMNAITGYDDKKQSYDAYQEAINRKNQFINNPNSMIPTPYNYFD